MGYQQMDGQHYGELGHRFAAVTILLQIVSKMDLGNLDIFLKPISTILAIFTALMAIRYYHYATKKAKQK